MKINKEVSFKCFHYSVSESTGKVKIVVQNKLNRP